jgi:DNA-binding NarL/FixJ family response regulator
VAALIGTREVDVVVIALRAADELALPIEVTADLAHRVPALVLLVDDASADWMADVLATGVFAVLPRDVSADELHAAVQSAGAGLLTISRDHYAALVGGRRGVRASLVRGAESLTRRESEVLAMLADGLANKEIAARLHISSHTVKTHVTSLFAKLGADSRAEAVAMGVRQGLILL